MATSRAPSIGSEIRRTVESEVAGYVWRQVDQGIWRIFEQGRTGTTERPAAPAIYVYLDGYMADGQNRYRVQWREGTGTLSIAADTPDVAEAVRHAEAQFDNLVATRGERTNG